MQTKRFKVSKRPPVQGFFGVLCAGVLTLPVPQLDVASLVPLELFYFLTGINPLLRLPRLLKVLGFIPPLFPTLFFWSLIRDPLLAPSADQLVL